MFSLFVPLFIYKTTIVLNFTQQHNPSTQSIEQQKIDEKSTIHYTYYNKIIIIKTRTLIGEPT